MIGHGSNPFESASILHCSECCPRRVRLVREVGSPSSREVWSRLQDPDEDGFGHVAFRLQRRHAFDQMSVNWQDREARKCQSHTKPHDNTSTFHKLAHVGHELTHFLDFLLVRTHWVISAHRDSSLFEHPNCVPMSFLLAFMRCENALLPRFPP